MSEPGRASAPTSEPASGQAAASAGPGGAAVAAAGSAPVVGDAAATYVHEQALLADIWRGVDGPVQRRAAGAVDDRAVPARAAGGLIGPVEALPHLHAIQASFGPAHDVSQIAAHVGGPATDAASAIGASAFATGNHVAFAAPPDLHTAAHEAAHVVQQRRGVSLYGGVGAVDDPYERHADAVADRVVAGQSAADLLGAGPRGADGPGAIQRKQPAAADTGADPATGPQGAPVVDAPASDDAETPHQLVPSTGAPWQVFAGSGKPYLFEDRGGQHGAWVVRKWVTSDPDVKRVKRLIWRAPGRARELLEASGWVTPERLAYAAEHLSFQVTNQIDYLPLTVGGLNVTGLPEGQEAVAHRLGHDGIEVTLSLDDPSIAPGTPHAVTASELRRAAMAAARLTGLPIQPDGLAFLTSEAIPPQAVTGNGTVYLTLDKTLGRVLFGFDAYDQWRTGKPPERKADDEPETPKLGLQNFYQRPIPGKLTHYADIIESGERVRLEVLVDWPTTYPDPAIYKTPPLVTPSKFGNVALLACDWTFTPISEAQARAMAAPRPRPAQAEPDAAGGARGGDGGPAPGVGATADGPAAAGAAAAGATEASDDAAGATAAGDDAAAATSSADTPAAAVAAPAPVDAGTSPESGLGGPAAAQADARQVTVQSTTTAEAFHAFTLPPEVAHGFWAVTCRARFPEYFEDTTFEPLVIAVMTPAAAMASLRTQAFGDFGVDDAARVGGKWKAELPPDFTPTPTRGGSATRLDPRAAARESQRAQLRQVRAYLAASESGKDAVEAIDRELERQAHTETTLANDAATGWQPFEVRGTYLSRTEGLESGPLSLYGAVRIEPSVKDIGRDKVVVRIRDLSRRFEQEDFVFESRGESFDDAFRRAASNLAVAYPKGRVAVEAEEIRRAALTQPDGRPGDDSQPAGTGKVIGIERTTETTWKKVKATVWSPVANIVTNLAAIALMTLVPASAPIVAPAITAYNSVPVIDNLRTESERGTLTTKKFGTSVAEIALNLLPMVGTAAPLTGKWLMVETANWGGQFALMTATAVEQARKLQATYVVALAEQYQAFLELQKSGEAAGPRLDAAEAQIRETANKVATAVSTEFTSILAENGIVIVTGTVVHSTAVEVRSSLFAYLERHAGGGTPHFASAEPPAAPPSGGDAPPPAPAGPPSDAGGSGIGQDAPTHHSSAELPDVPGARTPSAGDEQAAGSGGDLAEPTLSPERDPFSPEGLGQNAQALAKGHPGYNAVVGQASSKAAGLSLLQRLSRGDRTALAEIGFESPADFNPRRREWGLGRWGDKYVVIAGETHAVDWRTVAGVEPIAHSHPLDRSRATLQDGRRLSIDALVSRATSSGNDAALVFPSPADIQFMVMQRLSKHVVVVPYKHLGGNDITLASRAAGHSGVYFELSGPGYHGDTGVAHGGQRYSADAVMRTHDEVLWAGKIDAVIPTSGNPFLEFDVAHGTRHQPEGAPSASRRTRSGAPHDREPSASVASHGDQNSEAWAEAPASGRPDGQPVSDSSRDASTTAEAGAVRGHPATADAVRTGVVEMELHPEYEAKLRYAREHGFEVVTSDRGYPYVENVLIVGHRRQRLGERRVLALVPHMRFLDLEHELGHIQQIVERLADKGYTRVQKRLDDGRLVDVSAAAYPVPNKQEKDVIEYHNRLVEYVRLRQRGGVDTGVLDAHAEGVVAYRRLADLEGRRSSKIRAFIDEHFPDLSELEREFSSLAHGGQQ
ncbi:MAG: DUF4157 domain-containing protein [Kofleriaceae bacterium]